MDEYNLKIRLTANGTTTTLDPIVGTPASVALSDLSPNTDYEVEVVLQRDGGNTDVASDTETFRTSSGVDVNTPFYLENLTNNEATFTLTKNGTPTSTDLSYSLDGDSWSMFDLTAATNTVDVPANGRIYLRSSTGFSYYNPDYFNLNMNQNFRVCGNIHYLVHYNNLNSRLSSYCFNKLFYENPNLIDASSLIIPATPFGEGCFYYMFYGCSNLTAAPELPATTLARSCYYNMFYGCTSLTTAPQLPATTLATTCYNGMFQDCTSLKTAPELPATTLADRCYERMFRDCTSLITAPILPATTLVNDCYSAMFYNCTNLQSITTYVTDWNTDYTGAWLTSAGNNATNPTIYCPANSTLKDYTRNSSGIPSNWVQVDLP